MNWSTRRTRSFRASSPKHCATANRCGPAWLASWQTSRQRLMGCWSTGRGAIFSAGQSKEPAMQLIVQTDGVIRCLYEEALDLGALGALAITRASCVEPGEHGNWLADLAPVGGPVLGPFAIRSAAIAAERDWLESHILL